LRCVEASISPKPKIFFHWREFGAQAERLPTRLSNLTGLLQIPIIRGNRNSSQTIFRLIHKESPIKSLLPMPILLKNPDFAG
jgi:hypothetical protein